MRARTHTHTRHRHEGPAGGRRRRGGLQPGPHDPARPRRLRPAGRAVGGAEVVEGQAQRVGPRRRLRRAVVAQGSRSGVRCGASRLSAAAGTGTTPPPSSSRCQPPPPPVLNDTGHVPCMHRDMTFYGRGHDLVSTSTRRRRDLVWLPKRRCSRCPALLAEWRKRGGRRRGRRGTGPNALAIFVLTVKHRCPTVVSDRIYAVPACLPACHMPAFLLVSLSICTHACLPAFLPLACLPAHPSACMHAPG